MSLRPTRTSTYSSITMILMRFIAWSNNARKVNPWRRTKGQQKVWNRRPTGERYRQLEEEDRKSNKIPVDDGMKVFKAMNVDLYFTVFQI